MSKFHSNPSPYIVSRMDNKICVENEFTRWTHDLTKGGELTEAVVKFGSNRNLLMAPQKTVVSIIENRTYHSYSSDRLPVKTVNIEEKNGVYSLIFTQVLADKDGHTLPAMTVTHKVTYAQWGYGLHTVELHAINKIEEVGQVQAGTFYLSPSMDCCAIREATINAASPTNGNGVKRWLPLNKGKTREDNPVFLSRWLPLSVLMFERGMDGMEFCLGDDLGAWDNVGRKTSGWQQTYITYNNEIGGYEIRICPLDAFFPGQSLSGSYRFEFRMALPHVREFMTPLRPCAGGTFYLNRGFNDRWPSKTDISKWQDAGVSLMRLHNDGDDFNNRIFWRDAFYPPYPPEEMKKMDDFLRNAHDAGISVVPYFSVKEFHPESSGFDENARAWMRQCETNGEMIYNYSKYGIFGAQMCLQSDWKHKRRDTIGEVLEKHLFNGIYYDGCASECFNGNHTERGMHHWDQQALQELFEWSHKLAGDTGELYLHLTLTPNLPAENMASMILTEESDFGQINPFMFSPHVHFLNIGPRQICDMIGSKASDTDKRKLALCAFLHHATVSSSDDVYLSLHPTLPTQSLAKYKRHSAPGEGKCFTDNNDLGISTYWNENEAFIVLANTADQKIQADWWVNKDLLDMGWDSVKELKGKACLEPFQVQTLKIQKKNT